jgi:RNA ligase
MTNIDEIESIEHIQQLTVQGFTNWHHYGHVNARQQDDLLIFNYSVLAQSEARWNFFERVSRGLIINYKTGEIVARAFDKFFNWLEAGRTSNGEIVTVTEKVDGSLGVLYRTPGGYRVATRGSFSGMQAEWATRFLNDHYDLTGLPDELTLLFEIVYPANRIVVDYRDRQDLVLLAVRNRHTGEYLPFFPDVERLGQRYRFSLPQVHTFNEIRQLITRCRELDLSAEGFVVEFSDGSRFKFKGDRYLELQRLVMGLTFKNVLKAVSSGSTQTIFETVPDEFLTQVKQWVAEIEATVDEIKGRTINAIAQAPQESRKEFALWVNANHQDLRPYLFQMFDGRDLEPLIYKSMNRPEASVEDQ